jgi:hypothetical protein
MTDEWVTYPDVLEEIDGLQYAALANGAAPRASAACGAAQNGRLDT